MPKRPVHEVGHWVWVYDKHKLQQLRMARESWKRKPKEDRIKAELAKKRTGNFKILGVGPCRVRARFVGPKLLYLGMPFQKYDKPPNMFSVLR